MTSKNLTEAQKKLVTLLFTTKTVAPIGVRETLPDGKYKIYKKERPTSPIDFSQSEEEFAIKLHDTNPSAPLTPIYINLRNLPEVILDQIGVVFEEMDGNDKKPDFCTGIPKAGVPLGKAYSKQARVLYTDVFDKEEYPDGTRKIVPKAGIKGEGKTLRIVDDLVTKADTKVEAAEAAKAGGFTLKDITILVDRQQGGMDMMRDKGYKVRAAFTISQLLDYGLEAKLISQERYDTVMRYLSLPA
ncbi:hypothetical protein A3G67_00680 [Candidatus Roizmanbacteria bacterium RIFCSPLOWO2_12_FULL_40_12]|nr:MAG: hypothetical protein A2W49_00475 [Candidatus Roizmanbacteria bacterium RIFCSPHIGHO2_12_41_18]OGK58487.1 MAG: hypothetical protein A3H84_04275 [Candidatus Roizmanbacteria bacterium RIFCSPLOWO2_02_FULL_40_13]OGK60379.1 MAG: hypothetical protein A3G67_00680 [Candidatus Roizmanbacteria bacterium RIFCSPLOWO2_12_FULL_40_12]HLD79709.1 phosphoribosyltransferase family protein [Candidatus Nanoarchaeia archaeon]